MQRRKILWLTSWYPNRHDPFDGDFIQRHARAAVLFVCASDTDEVVTSRATGLTEEIHYFAEPKGLLGRVRKHWTWKKEAEEAITDHIEKEGRPDLVHVQVSWKAGLLAQWVRKSWGIPYLLSEHWSIFVPGSFDAFEGKSYFVRTAIRRIFREARAVIAVSRFLADAIEEATGRQVKHVVPNVVDTTLFFPGGEKYEGFSFIHVSNMAPVKRTDALLAAFARFSEKAVDTRLVLVGNRDPGVLASLPADQGLHNRVFARGEVSYREVAEELRRCHALVLFSATETFSCVTAEALCCGIPVVVPRAGALPELVDASNGILVEPGNSQALEAALGAALEGAAGFDAPAIARAAAARYGYGPIAEAFDRLYRHYTV